MPVIIGPGIALSGAVVSDQPNGNNPIIGYDNRVTTGNVSASSADEDHPAVNVANVNTWQYWQGNGFASPTDDEFLTVIVDSVEPIDYVGIARHNFFTAQIPVTVEVQSTDGAAWVAVTSEGVPSTDGPLIYRFEEQSVYAVRVHMGSPLTGTTAPQVGVLYLGKLLVLQRRIYVGHTPITMGRVARITNARSETGNFLGRIVLSEARQTRVTMRNLLPDWYREYLDPFIEDSKEIPFFFAWRPLDYPNEVGYAWMTNEPVPTNQLPNGMMQVELQMTGIAP
jgi:hypothetical protein